MKEKQMFSCIVLSILALMSFTMTSCSNNSDDSEGDATRQAIIGTWYCSSNYKRITFKSDGTMEYSRVTSSSYAEGSGTYSVSGTTITYSMMVGMAYSDDTSQGQEWKGSDMEYKNNTIIWANAIYNREN